MNKIYILKFFDALFGKMFCHFLLKPHRQATFLRPISKILIIRPGGIGDAVLVLPLIKALKKKHPDILIDILAEKRNSAIFFLCADIQKIYHYEKPHELLPVIRGNYDAVIDTEQWHRLSAVVARLSRAPMLIGYATNERRKLFTHPIPYSHNVHEIDAFLRLLAPIVGDNCTSAAEERFISIPHELSKSVEPFLRPLVGKKLVVIFPGGSIKKKRWETIRYREAAMRLMKQGYGIVIVGGKMDISIGNEIVNNQSNIVNLCGTLTLLETAAVLHKSALLISGDSGILHIASALGTRVLALFGPSNIKKWAPRSEHSFIMSKYLSCSPCSKFGYTPRCKNDLACMEQITVNEVFENAVKLLER